MGPATLTRHITGKISFQFVEGAVVAASEGLVSFTDGAQVSRREGSVSSGIVRRVDFVTVAVLDIPREYSAGARELSSVSYCGGGEGGSAT